MGKKAISWWFWLKNELIVYFDLNHFLPFIFYVVTSE